MPNPLWPLRRQGPNRWLRWGATFVCLAQFLVIVVVVVKACLDTEGGCHWYSFLRTAFVGHKFRSLPVERASSEIVLLPPRKDFDSPGPAAAAYGWRRLSSSPSSGDGAPAGNGTWCAARNAVGAEMKCVCGPGWTSPSCSVPRRLISKPSVPVKLAARPKNVICAFGIRFDELEFAELKIRSLAPFVEVFVVTRVFVTVPPSSSVRDALYDKFASGWLADLQEKIIYVPPGGAGGGVGAEPGVFRRLAAAVSARVSDFRRDDVVVFLRPEELPLPEAVATLRYHDGLTDVVGASYARTAFNFGAALGTVSVSPMAVTFQAFWKRFNYTFPAGIDENSDILGSSASPAGWTCKWCLSRDALVNRVKLFTELSVAGDRGRLAALELHEMVSAREKVKRAAAVDFLPEYAVSYPGKYGFLLKFAAESNGPFLWADPTPV